ncbi:ornithine cyclodeaminase family protein [Agrobacterium tumefaciens]|uniref:ornithine cyclodeaminase family protein n=1 Tax=Agrobacterium tumefaciens TaxID=358 RepID=UPI00287ED106|nr:ornithine cyclodeaminase family protein [Agrobacterium tumefaciens]MDS7596844.1 ornithine cyclodeaminase family protein [Agrobacterium tumefaciens]
MTTILTDQDLSGGDIMPIAIEAVEAAMRKKALGELVAPPRHHVAFPGKGDLVFTVGGLVGDDAIAGFRVYDTFAGNEHSQIVAVWSADTARLEGLVLGEKLGAIRTGAIGGVAIRHLSSEDARTVGIIGSGLQARTQLAAAAAVRRLSHARVFSRDDTNRHAFATEMKRQLDIDIQPAKTVEDTVADADIVICATSSTTPVIHAQSLKPGVHINTVGPKTVNAHELGKDVAAAASLIATDSPDQIRAYASPFFLAGTLDEQRIRGLSEIVAGQQTGRQSPDEVTLFCSTGLAGTDVAVAAALLRRKA